MTSWDRSVRPLRPPVGGVAAAILFVTALLPVAPARANVIHVPGDQPTIQAGIDAAAFFGDEVVLADGIYSGAGNHSLTLIKHITVRSASRNPALCIIDCGASGRGFLISGVVSAAKIEGLTIRNGLADTGGGISCDNASPTLENCWIIGNTANSVAGGGLALQNNSSPIVRNCRFVGNLSTGFWGGGAVWNYGGDPVFLNCTFSHNRAQGVGVLGGAFMCLTGSQMVLTNCTLYGNFGYNGSSAVYSEGTGTSTTFINSVIWGHDPGTSGVVITALTGAVVNISYSDVQGGWAGTGNLATNPGLIDPDGPDNVPGTVDDNLRPGRFSPLADAGTNAAAGLVGVTLDADGNPRFVDDANIPDTGSGSAPLVDMGAYERQEDSVAQMVLVPGDAATIQAGIDLAQPGDEVVVADGTWTGSGNRDLLVTKNIILRSASGNPSACVIDCQGATRGIRFQGASNAAVVRGLRITGGVADEGAGILFDASDGTVLGCRIDGNQANNVGGAGVRIRAGSNPHLVSTVITGNTTTGIGVTGGALSVIGGSLPVIENCTLYGNTAYDGGVMFVDGSGTLVTVVNSIVWANTNAIVGTRILILGGAVQVTYSDVEGGYAGTGNINVNPIIMDADFRLAPISACIDAGNNAAVTLEEDYDGHLRIFDGDGDAQADVDMGAFEYGSSSAVGIPDFLGESRIRLLKVWPNPSRLQAAIRFALPDPGAVSLEVFDLSGRRVASLLRGSLGAGEHEVVWDGHSDRGDRAVPGVYFLRLSTPAGTEGRSLIRVR